MAGDFEKFGVDIEINGVNSAVSNLDRFEKRYEKIAGTEIRVAKSEIALKNAHISLQQSEQSLANATKVSENAQKQKEIAVNNVAKAHERLLAIEKNENATELQRTIAAMKYSNSLLQQGIAENILTIANTNLNKARETQEKRVNAVTTAELSLQQAMEAAEKQQNRTTKSLTAYLAKLSSGVMIARRLGSFVSSAIQESANYVENLNLFAVAYGDVYKETLGWALDLADGFGLASNEVLKFAGTFRQLSTSLGLVKDTANSVSQTVTQLGYDMSALFNTSVENAMEKLQSGLFSGNVRPLRAYGIDISQNQIDALFETNEALASLGVNARNLSQSDKVLARLIITLRDGSNAFGTMNREINTLQSQIRILQGSFSNFKLAIGDLVYEPTRKALVVVNAFIMAVTNIIRRIKPLQTEDKNNIFNGVAIGAEEANSEIDELNGKLADFDKFNVLGGQSQGYTSSAITDALTAELAKQQEYYAQQVALMDDIENEAKELAKSLEPLVIGFGVLATILAVKKISSSNSWFLAFASKETGDSIAKIATSIGGLTKGTQLFAGVLKTLTGPIGIILAVVGVLYATNEEFRNSINGLISSLAPLLNLAVDLIGQVLKPIIPLLSGLANILGVVLSFVVKVATGIIYVAEVIVGVLLSPIELIIKGISTILVLLETLFTWNWSALGEKLSKLWSNWAIGDIIVGGSQGLATTVRGYADGGYTNANLIMTHENGKREWVGKAAGSSAIVNDTQMSDIMETAVAKGVYRALSSSRTDGGSGGTTKNVYNFQVNGRTLLSVMEDEARKQGKALQRI